MYTEDFYYKSINLFMKLNMKGYKWVGRKFLLNGKVDPTHPGELVSPEDSAPTDTYSFMVHNLALFTNSALIEIGGAAPRPDIGARMLVDIGKVCRELRDDVLSEIDHINGGDVGREDVGSRRSAFKSKYIK